MQRHDRVVVGVIIFTFTTVAPIVLGLPVYSEDDVTDLGSKDVPVRLRHKGATFLLNGGPNSRGQKPNGTNAPAMPRYGSLRIRRSPDDDYAYKDDKHEDYYEGGGAQEVGGGRKRMIAFTIFFIWVCWVIIACSILRIVAKNMA
ncbi:uncharacterized protein LOC110979393 [Acanthaster planci]|uniref:Uncharacterized protein LOC110979393 n=1 Tax=Acanthaster planci TaxID=133434 RepID=A0A8B7YGS2_ACAPL|nr:uncharacterized protein LOC110979393 [Acanthaster planci]